MRQPDGDFRCQWCRRPFPPARGPGRPRRYCRRSCRQRDYEARRRADELGLDETQLIIARRELDALTDQMYVLEAAIEDVTGDISRSAQIEDYQAAMDLLLSAARPLIAMGLAAGLRPMAGSRS